MHNLNDRCCHWLLWFKLCIVAIWGKFRPGPVWDHWRRTISPQSEKDKGLSRQDRLLMHWAQGLQKEHWLCTLKSHWNSKGLVRLQQILLEATDLGCISGVRHSQKVLSRQAEGLGTHETSHLNEPTSNWGRQRQMICPLICENYLYGLWTHSWPTHLTYHKTGGRPQPSHCLHICM